MLGGFNKRKREPSARWVERCFGGGAAFFVVPILNHILTYTPSTCFNSSLVAEWRIEKRVAEQFQAFLTGFNELISPDLITVFDERELELLIGGMAEIDVEDWKKHTDYRGYTENDAVIQNFWAVSRGCCGGSSRSSSEGNIESSSESSSETSSETSSGDPLF